MAAIPAEPKRAKQRTRSSKEQRTSERADKEPKKRSFARCYLILCLNYPGAHPAAFVWFQTVRLFFLTAILLPVAFPGFWGPCEMDTSTISSSASSQRRRLTKKPPSAAHHHSHYSSPRFSATPSDRLVDAQSLGSKRSSTSLKRAPSAPVGGNRTPASNASDSSPRFPAAQYSPAFSLANRSHAASPSSTLPDGKPAAPSASSHPHYHYLHARADAQQPRSGRGNSLQPLSSKTSDELIGAPFDGTAILDRIAATKSPTNNNNDNDHHDNDSDQTLLRFALPQPPRANPGTRTMGHSPPPLRQSVTFPTGDLPVLSEKGGASRPDGALSHKRYSDESKESKIPSMLRKKSGFSGFMTSLVGSPKKPLISAPENPVHVTHVGYDSSTGQFTVWNCPRSLLCPLC
jgi:p21-activated kinase 1